MKDFLATTRNGQPTAYTVTDTTIINHTTQYNKELDIVECYLTFTEQNSDSSLVWVLAVDMDEFESTEEACVEVNEDLRFLCAQPENVNIPYILQRVRIIFGVQAA